MATSNRENKSQCQGEGCDYDGDNMKEIEQKDVESQKFCLFCCQTDGKIPKAERLMLHSKG
jgi:hypothetical protein